MLLQVEHLHCAQRSAARGNPLAAQPDPTRRVPVARTAHGTGPTVLRARPPAPTRAPSPMRRRRRPRPADSPPSRPPAPPPARPAAPAARAPRRAAALRAPPPCPLRRIRTAAARPSLHRRAHAVAEAVAGGPRPDDGCYLGPATGESWQSRCDGRLMAQHPPRERTQSGATTGAHSRSHAQRTKHRAKQPSKRRPQEPRLRLPFCRASPVA